MYKHVYCFPVPARVLWLGEKRSLLRHVRFHLLSANPNSGFTGPRIYRFQKNKLQMVPNLLRPKQSWCVDTSGTAAEMQGEEVRVGLGLRAQAASATRYQEQEHRNLGKSGHHLSQHQYHHHHHEHLLPLSSSSSSIIIIRSTANDVSRCNVATNMGVSENREP